MNTAEIQNIEILKGKRPDKQTWQLFLQSKKMEAIGSLASGLAHDFNNILSSIQASAQFLHTREGFSKEEIEAIADIENRVICGAEVVKQLLSFSKPGPGNSGATLLNQRIQMLRRLLKRITPRNIVISLALPDDEHSVKMSASELDQILMNLVINARDAMPDGGAIVVKVQTVNCTTACPIPVPNARHGRYAQIEVSDTGKGIPARNISKIFDPYFSSKHGNGGTGLGLAIVYSIIQRHKGYIMVSSKQGMGTTFTIFLPARRASQKQADCSVASHEALLGGGETILLVDDEPIIAKSTAHFLERYGYHTITASDGKNALTEFGKHINLINVVLLDLELPEMDGLECLRRMLAIAPETRVIAMSGHFIRPDVWDPMKAGAKAFLQKPFDLNNLLKAIRATVAKR